MSIASEISRIESAKAAIKTAIEGKGVTVPSSAKLDDYALLIDSIATGGDPELPSGYTRHSYIYGDGSAYINTGISGNATWVVIFQADSGQTAKFIVAQGNSAGQYFGEMSTGNLGFSTSSTQYVASSSVSPTSKFCASVLFGGDRTAATINGYGIYRNGSVTRTGVFALFSLTSTGTSIIAGKMWAADAWVGNSHTFHGIPCTRNSDNKAGLYDTVSKAFFPSSSSSDFTAGDD